MIIRNIPEPDKDKMPFLWIFWKCQNLYDEWMKENIKDWDKKTKENGTSQAFGTHKCKKCGKEYFGMWLICSECYEKWSKGK